MANSQSNNEVEVLFDYDQPQHGELRLTKGSRLKRIKMEDDGWLMAMNPSACTVYVSHTSKRCRYRTSWLKPLTMVFLQELRQKDSPMSRI